MNGSDIRRKFLDFFKKNGHTSVTSSSLIPADDPTLLFSNAGMNQFKDIFLGKEKRSYTRATSIQKCVRAGGKHNDLDEVGFSERHLTFFEMMGNFSFGDYFKKEAIQFAWNFLTKEMGFEGEKLYPTVFETDDEAYDLWHKTIGVPAERITRLGTEDNFWQMGDTGPCGPCSEILYDRGEKYGCNKLDCKPGCDCARYNEVWNLVFMQFNRQDDGELKPLTKTGVDTGMGFERLCMLSQGTETVYDIDIMQAVIKEIEKLTDKKYSDNPVAFRVLTDHIRSSCLIIADGGIPSNDGRGYVLRKIIRRAALFAKKLSSKNDLFPKLAKAFINSFSPIYPELKKNEALIIKLLKSEIDRFISNLESGEQILEKYLKNNKTGLSGEQAFKLYDTYGFPLELTLAVVKERGLEVDIEGFEENMERQQRQSGKKGILGEALPSVPQNVVTEHLANDNFEISAKIIFVDNGKDATWIVTDKTPFYVESGGQINDTGSIEVNGKKYSVLDLKKSDGAILVKIEPVNLKVNDSVKCVVDRQKRMDTVRNHTATHLLQAALMQVLGKNVKQSGSLVDPDHLRFDFTHTEAMNQNQIDQVEKIINDIIQENIKTKVWEGTLKEAQDAGAIAFFEEKYNPEKVRVVEVPGFSIELCGGTHADNTGIIGAFKITSESALATGVRRIVAITGPKAIELFQASFKIAKKLGEEFKVKPEQVLDAIEKQRKNYNEALREIKKLKKHYLKDMIPTWQKEVKSVGEIPFLYLEIEDLPNDEIKSLCVEIERKTPGFFFIISKSNDRANFLAYLSKKYSDKVNLKELGSFLKEHGLRSGGSPTVIQGSGEIKSNLKELIINWLK